jgi:hypothetical protein
MTLAAILYGVFTFLLMNQILKCSSNEDDTSFGQHVEASGQKLCGNVKAKIKNDNTKVPISGHEIRIFKVTVTLFMKNHACLKCHIRRCGNHPH